MPPQSLLVKAQAAITRSYSRALESLPALAPQAHDLLALDASDPRADRALLRIVESDPAYSARLLGLANSSAYCRGKRDEPLCSVAQTFPMLGLTKVLEIGVAHYLAGALPDPEATARLHRVALWRRAMLVAFASRDLARIEQPALANVAFGAGLVHDIGLIVLEHLNFAGYQTVLLEAQRRACSPRLLEHELLGISHEDIGAIVAQAWHLPAPLVTVIQSHHSPDLPPQSLVGLVARADELSHHPDVVALAFADIGEPYLSLCRETPALAEGDVQVTRLAAQVNWVITLSGALAHHG